ncbi:MAG: diacylglycerol kinase family lipid kinase [Chloroflexota bacterium]
MRTVVIFNPAADHGRARRLQSQIPDWAEEFGGCDLWLTERPGHAAVLARRALDQGYELVIAAGGDGTMHEVANGLVESGQSGSLTAGAPMGIVPIGSGNDYPFGLGLAADPHEAFCRIFNGRQMVVDLALYEDDHGRSELAINGIGIGFDAIVSIQTQTITRVHGFAMYFLATLRTLAFYYQTPNLRAHFDDLVVEQRTLMLPIGIGPRIGGGFRLTPDADLTDGLLDTCMVNPIGRPTLLRLLPEAMKGTHTDSPHVTMRRNRCIELVSDMALPIHADGEIFAYLDDDVRQIRVTSLPAALTIRGAGF